MRPSVARERSRDDQHVHRAEQHVELLRGANPVGRFGGVAPSVDGGICIPMARMSRAGDAHPPEPEQATDSASQHAVRRKLIEGPGSQLTVLKESFTAARVRASACSAIGSADAPLLAAIGRSAGQGL